MRRENGYICQMTIVFCDLTYIIWCHRGFPSPQNFWTLRVFCVFYRLLYFSVLLNINYSVARKITILIYNNNMAIKVSQSSDVILNDSVITYETGSKYIGETSQQKRHGRGIFTWASGEKYDGKIIINALMHTPSRCCEGKTFEMF